MTSPTYGPAGVVIAGRPHTGKTTYLALLYLAIAENRAAGLTLGTFRDDREYLNRISRQLQRCQPAAHTEVAEQQELSLSLLVGADRKATLLRIPDTSGETWDTALTERQWNAKLDAQVRRATAIMLFTHSKDDFDAGTTIVDANAADAALLDLDVPTPIVAGPRLPHRHSPTQVELVDLLQMLCEQRGPRPARAVLIISAYDLISPRIAPQEWVDKNCPLLAQYVSVNRTWLDFAVFGVSAQGGRFDDETTLGELIKLHALDRAMVLAGDGKKTHPEAPVLWTLQARG